MSPSLRNQIPCTAERLGQLSPQMLKAITEGSAFGIGHQYFSERRVRIVRADDAEISSEVAGAGGLYAQTISLAGGTLVTKCSCPSKERPLCRHCVAALLEYHRQHPDRPLGWSAPPPAPDAADSEGGPQGSPLPATEGISVRLREIATLLDWIQGVVAAVHDGRSLPGAPPGVSGNVLQWVRAVQRLDERGSRGEEEAAALRADLGAQREQLDAAARELDSTKVELERCRSALNALLEREHEQDRLARTIHGMTGELMKKAADVDQLVAAFRSQDARPT